MVLDASLLNTQHYKVRIKGKVEQSREGVAPSPIEKGAFGLPSTMVANFTYFTYIRVCVCEADMALDKGGARGVKVIVVGIGNGVTSSKPGRD